MWPKKKKRTIINLHATWIQSIYKPLTVLFINFFPITVSDACYHKRHFELWILSKIQKNIRLIASQFNIYLFLFKFKLIFIFMYRVWLFLLIYILNSLFFSMSELWPVTIVPNFEAAHKEYTFALFIMKLRS